MERKHRILVTEKTDIQTVQLARLLPQFHGSAQIETSSRLNPQALERNPDMIIADCSEAEALSDVVLGAYTAVLFLGEEHEVSELLPFCVSNGFLCMERRELTRAFPQLLAMSNRLYAMQAREDSLQKKLGDTKLVNRAKLLLISRLQMSETEAHRYIEKTAMDTGESRREVALRLIRTYEE